MSGQVLYFELDLSGPDDGIMDAQPPRRNVRPGLGLALAFAIGLALGAAGFLRAQSSAEQAALQAEISLVAALDSSVSMQPGPYAVVVYNAGPLPVRVDRPRLVAPGYADPTPPGTATRVVQPGTWDRMATPVGEPVCPPPATLSGKARFMALVTAADGRTQPVDVLILDNHGTLDNARYGHCATILNPEQALAIWIDAAARANSSDGQGTLHISSWAWETVEVASIESAPGLDVSLARELPLLVAAQSMAAVDITINVVDCELLPDDGSGAVTYVTTRYRNQTFRHEIWVEPIELMRTAECG